ncbi:DUF4377 domain-containing protein [Fluviicola chungangensis]|uniref:DUF4377 domain-containing protein n=1 Tax=Fluviicola chungangensis TaxID=2597671 RepID=A0A556N7W1_9FLAO|nr:DUF4377 domain-containing protein [Fluviicola chungangensis]TSJ48220.1 DUF4377 domain-containing protein [Fluviicola chungangensis]
MFKVLLITLSLATISFTSKALNHDPQLIHSDAGEVIKMRVQGHRVECQQNTDVVKWCYSVQKGASIGMETWEVLQQPIEGFTFEEGYTYDLIVRIDMQQGKTGSERFKYTLVEIISKIKES